MLKSTCNCNSRFCLFALFYWIAIATIHRSSFVVESLVEHEHSHGGWEMKDRFSGFRFEIVVDDSIGIDIDVDVDVENEDDRNRLTSAVTAMMDDIVAKADEQFCFGWIQSTKRNTFVGEARCIKRNGWMLKRYMMERVQSKSIKKENGKKKKNKITFKDYKDTKIKLHFSHFKILDPERETCFRDEPHQCPEEDLLVSLW